jgi:hypothetical protein
MPFLLEFALMFFIGLVVPILLFRWFLQKYVGSDKGTIDTAESYGRGWGDAHWQRLNNRQSGEAEKSKPTHDFEGARIQASPTPMHIPDTSRLAVEDNSDPVPLSDLLQDEKSKKSRR